MTSYTTNTSDRCDAKNKLTCRVHGVAGDFTEVPKYVRDNIDRQRNLNEDFQDARAAYLEYAHEIGIKPADIDYVIQGDFPTDASLDEVDSLVNLYNEYTEAAQAADEESELQSAEVKSFLNQRIKEVFPEADERQREMLDKLVGLRFAAIERELELEEEPSAAGDFADIYQDQAKRRGWTFDNMIALSRGSMSKPRLRELDRSYFTALSGRIPTDEQLDRVEYMRRIRRSGPLNDKERTQEAWEYGIQLSSIS